MNGDGASIRVARIIEWSDTDATGHVHNTVANRLMEAAEAELLRRLGLIDLVPAMPRVRMTYEFRARLYFGDEVTVHLRVRELGTTSLTWTVDVRKPDGAPAITGEVVVVHAPGPRAEPWPDRARAALTAPAG